MIYRFSFTTLAGQTSNNAIDLSKVEAIRSYPQDRVVEVLFTRRKDEVRYWFNTAADAEAFVAAWVKSAERI